MGNDAPNPQNIDRATDSDSTTTDRGLSASQLASISSGFHMPPQVLGRSEDSMIDDDDDDDNNEDDDPNNNNNNNNTSTPGKNSKGKQQQQQQQQTSKRPHGGAALADLNKGARKRLSLAVKATKSKAAAAAAVKGVAALSSNQIDADNIAIDSTMFTFVVYQGMEVIFSNTGHHCIVGVCSRTNYLFQKLNLASKAPIVSITSNSSSGMVIVAHEDGVIQTYTPIPTDPVDLSNDSSQRQQQQQQQRPKSVYGKYRWIDCTRINAAETFYQPGETVKFCDRRRAKPGDVIDITSSYDYKLLVAHRQQLAVFDAAPLPPPPLPSTETKYNNNNNSKGKEQSPVGTMATLLWTTMLSTKVVTAKLSGDGQAIVVVLDQPNNNSEYGAMTFLHDADDGSIPSVGPPSTIKRSMSTGMVFKPGPYLQHSRPVTRISFRGLGHMTASADPEKAQGNDLLLTYCEEDSAVRIFNQNAWQQLMIWAAPPNSRADWIRGTSAFSLGDLETHKKTTNSRLLRPGSRRPSNNSSELSNATGGINSGLRNSVRTGGLGSPSSAAGAWIAEITFRGAYPALRLSRLSYMKRGNDDSQPAHFESIAAILPAGSIVAGSVLNADDMGLSIQGIWPAWNPWLSEPSANTIDETLSGSAMQFLGLSSMSPVSNATFGESYAGGTHSPPTELRIVASQPKQGNVVVMEFPLWGDDDFGAMELGSPIRSVLALSEVPSLRADKNFSSRGSASMDYESSLLSAEIESDCRSISLIWRREGSMAIHSSQWSGEDAVFKRQASNVAEPKAPDFLMDLSVVPVPLALPILRLPKGKGTVNEDTIVAIKWWPDESFGGPPLLVAVTKSTTLLVYEIPPPIFALEPSMPNFDSTTAQSSIASGIHDATITESDGEESTMQREEYDVLVTPHPDFGLGLRLESPMDGLPAIAGSFKKNPLNDGMLPAEKTGMIRLGDELLSVNGVSLENMTFDDIIATVRHVGAEAGPGEPLKMRFRPVPTERARKNSAVVHESFSVRSGEGAHSSSPMNDKSLDTSSHRGQDAASLAAVLFGSSSEAQQEFGRVIAVVRKAIAVDDQDDFSDRFIVLPWNSEMSVAESKRMRATALTLHAVGSKIQARRLELPSRTGLDKARNIDLGTIDLNGNEGSGAGPLLIRSIGCVESAGERMCFVVGDSVGCMRLLYLHFRRNEGFTSDGCRLQMSHEDFRIIHAQSDIKDFSVRASSPGVIAAIQKSESPRRVISVWHSRPDSSARELHAVGATKDQYLGEDYISSRIVVDPSESGSELVDLRFLETGRLESFPTMVAFLTSEAIVYQRRGGSKNWIPVIRLSYPAILSSTLKVEFDDVFGRLTDSKPLESYPHILQSIRTALTSYDEKIYMLSDWSPESLLAHLCMEERGAKVALKGDVKRIFLWLSDRIDGSPDDNISAKVPLLVAPCSLWAREIVSGGEMDGNDDADAVESASSLMTGMIFDSSRNKVPNEDETKLKRLCDLLTRSLGNNVNGSAPNGSNVTTKVEKTYEDAIDTLPDILSTLKTNELRVLAAILQLLMKPPRYGKLDSSSQLALTLYKLHKEMKENANETENKPTTALSVASFSAFRVNRQATYGDTEKLHPQNASAGCLAALLSDYQEMLIDTIRPLGEKLDWETVRDLRVPFWLRSDDKLRQLSEEVGQKMYRDSKDILKSAVFFVVAGKKRTLINLAAADSTDSGRKFYKFLTDHDFTSERGRSAAEKNAFSLLRKNKYESAAAFFLLAEPPILKSAVETIATKMEDLDLAFLVARLIGNSKPSAIPGGFGIGGGIGGFGGVLGGGGGYAGSGMPIMEVTKDKDSFKEWKRTLDSTAKRLLLDRCLPTSYDDPCLSAVQLIWLGRFDEASHWLTGLVAYENGILPSFVEDVTIPQLKNPVSLSKNSRDATITVTNRFINLVSGPFLLKTMEAAARTRLAANIAISRGLAKAGIEVVALRSLMQNVEDSSSQEKERTNSAIDATPKITNGSLGHTDPITTSSIFDSFDAPPRPVQKAPGPAPEMASSIFDSFDAPRPVHKAPAPVPEMTFSIFDSFDAPPRPAPKAPPPAPEMASSIFDSFDAPQPVAKAPAPAPEMASSIFDSFDAPQPVAKAPAPAPEMASSIFDSFDAPPRPAPKTPTPAPAPATGQMSSSIFDSFETPQMSKQTSSPKTPVFVEKEDEKEFRETSEIRKPPPLWTEWQDDIMIETAARRLIRELATLCAPYHCDSFDQQVGSDKQALITSGASQVLHFHCDGEELISEVKKILQNISSLANLDSEVVLKHAVQLLHSPHEYHRTLYVILLLLAVKEVEVAEDVVRNTAQSLISLCYSNSFSNGHVSTGTSCVTYLSNLYIQKLAAHLSWQLELCLWIHRGGALPLSGLALNEAICAVRIGFLIASWSRDFELQETMLRQPPDCLMDETAGKQLWTSLKIISGGSSADKKVTGTGSGGWEFLVDCRRSEATEMLRPRPTGCFIIRPHPEDHGVFTLSFKTNLVPTQENDVPDTSSGDESGNQTSKAPKKPSRPIKKDDVVQHAIIRLSDSGFRCGSFGPFATLMKLLEAVSASLPFDLRFDLPPTEGIIQDEGSKPSPNSVCFRKLAMHKAEFANKAPIQQVLELKKKSSSALAYKKESFLGDLELEKERERQEKFGLFLELLLLSELRKQAQCCCCRRIR